MCYWGMGGLLVVLVLVVCSLVILLVLMVVEDLVYVVVQQQWWVVCYQDLIWLDGWIVLVGLYWLQNKLYFVGSGVINGICLMVGLDKLGLLCCDGVQWWFMFEVGVDVSYDGQLVCGCICVDIDKDVQLMLLVFDGGKGQFSIICWGLWDVLWVKYVDVFVWCDFVGLQYWLGGVDWQVQVCFIVYLLGKILLIVDIIGLIIEMFNVGVVEFECDGCSWCLEVIGVFGQLLFLIFVDCISGRGSYLVGCYLDIDVFVVDGMVCIDFNYVYNLLCVFIVYVICLLVLLENWLDLCVEVGEKVYYLFEGEG